MEKLRSFFFHYNKPASKKAGRPILSVHFKGQCILVDNIDCRVKTAGRVRRAQPYFVMAGKARGIDIVGNVALIY